MAVTPLLWWMIDTEVDCLFLCVPVFVCVCVILNKGNLPED